MVGVLLFFVSLLSWIMAMCMLLSVMYFFNVCSFRLMPSMLNWRIFMLYRVVPCRLYVVWLGGGGGGVLCGSGGTLAV